MATTNEPIQKLINIHSMIGEIVKRVNSQCISSMQLWEVPDSKHCRKGNIFYTMKLEH